MDIETIFALIDKAQASLFDHIEIKSQDFKLCLERQPRTIPMNSVQISNSLESAAESEIKAQDKASLKEQRDILYAPISGIFYRRRDPESQPFVEAGSHVYKGQPLCIIEAMKMMNEVCAPKSCVIEQIFHENNEPIKAGDALFAFAKEG